MLDPLRETSEAWPLFYQKPFLTRQPPPNIPLEIHQRLCGGLLGDGSLDFHRNKKMHQLISVRYREKHAAAQVDLVLNQQNGLLPFTKKIKRATIQKDKNGYYFVETRTSRTKYFNVYGEVFYQSEKINGKWKNKKQLPKNIGELIDNPLSLGVWIAGDGNPHGKAFSICTHGFSESENSLLQDVLKQNFQVQARVAWHSNGLNYYPHLYLPREEAAKLISKCDSQIAALSSVRHKFDFS